MLFFKLEEVCAFLVRQRRDAFYLYESLHTPVYMAWLVNNETEQFRKTRQMK